MNDETKINLSGNSVSRVWIEGNKIFKRQPKFLCDNEDYALTLLAHTGIVPYHNRIDDELIEMEFVENSPITDKDAVIEYVDHVLYKFRLYAIRHGDLTTPHIFYCNNKIRIIDFGESRPLLDPRSDKRPKGDDYWLRKTVSEAMLETES